MAITQQLARMNSNIFFKCCENAEQFSQLISFKLLPEKNYLDLCWASEGLKVLSRLSGQTYNAHSALYVSCDGTRPVFLNSDETWGPIFSIQAEEVRLVFSGLAEINLDRLLGSVPKEECTWNRFFGSDKPSNPEAYYKKYFNLLFAFYKKAADSGESVIVWLD